MLHLIHSICFRCAKNLFTIVSIVPNVSGVNDIFTYFAQNSGHKYPFFPIKNDNLNFLKTYTINDNTLYLYLNTYYSTNLQVIIKFQHIKSYALQVYEAHIKNFHFFCYML